MDTLTVKAVQLEGKHGYYDSERRQGNRFELDVIIKGDFRPAAVNDDLNQAFNYEAVVEEARKVMNGPSHKLIESLCKKIGDALFERSSDIKFMELALRKLNPPLEAGTSYVEIRMQWQR